jgi:hypothetical protein
MAFSLLPGGRTRKYLKTQVYLTCLRAASLCDIRSEGDVFEDTVGTAGESSITSSMNFSASLSMSEGFI